MNATPIRRDPRVNLDPPEEYRESIGEMVMRLSRLDYQLGVIARVASNLSKADQRRLFFKLRGDRLCDALELLAVSIKSKTLAAEVRELARNSARLNERRNDFVHSVYGDLENAPGVMMRFRLATPKQGQDIVAAPASAAEMQQFIEEISDAQNRAEELTRKVKDYP